MSERIDIPVSTLSKVEHDRLTLTYDKLLQLSQRLNIRMSELFADPGEPKPSRRSPRGAASGASTTPCASTRRTTTTTISARSCAASA